MARLLIGLRVDEKGVGFRAVKVTHVRKKDVKLPGSFSGSLLTGLNGLWCCCMALFFQGTLCACGRT